jgi:hypothetical protein
MRKIFAFAFATLCFVSGHDVASMKESIISTTEACNSGKLTDIAGQHITGEAFTWEENNAKWTCAIRDDGYECNVKVVDPSFTLKSQTLANTQVNINS